MLWALVRWCEKPARAQPNISLNGSASSIKQKTHSTPGIPPHPRWRAHRRGAPNSRRTSSTVIRRGSRLCDFFGNCRKRPPRVKYYGTLSMGKELAMVENNARGRMFAGLRSEPGRIFGSVNIRTRHGFNQYPTYAGTGPAGL